MNHTIVDEAGKKCKPIYCICGEEMIPEIYPALIVYKCPKKRFYNFFNHSLSIDFLNKNLTRYYENH